MDRFIARFPDVSWKFVKCVSNEEGCTGTDVIITITNANANLVEEPWVKKGALVMTMDSFREIPFDVDPGQRAAITERYPRCSFIRNSFIRNPFTPLNQSPMNICDGQ